MACTYISETVFQSFTDGAALDAALDRVGRGPFVVNGLDVFAIDPAALPALRQAYQVEKAKIAARKKGFLVSETKQPDGKIKLTVRGR